MDRNMPLGASTWVFNGILPPQLKAIVDGNDEYPQEQMHAVYAYFVELANALVHSEIREIQLWYSSVFAEDVVLEQLHRLGAAHRVSSIHAPFGPGFDLSSVTESVRDAGVQACKEAARLLLELGGNKLVVHASTRVADVSRMPERVENSIGSVVEIADYCAENGISVGVELLPGPDFVGGSVEELIRLLDLAGRSNVGAWLDVNHVFPHDQLSAVVELLGHRILGLHIADYDGIEEKHWLPKQGVIDWKRLIGDLTRVGYVGPFTYEARFEAADLDDAVAILEGNYYSLMSQAGE